jgi:hypothetical protein
MLDTPNPLICDMDDFIHILLLVVHMLGAVLRPTPLLPEDDFVTLLPTLIMALITISQHTSMLHQLRIRGRINNWVIPNRWTGRNAVEMVSSHGHEFLTISGETTNTFEDMLGAVRPILCRNIRGRPCVLSPGNRLLMTFVWLRNYPTYMILSAMFAVSRTTVGDIVTSVWPVLWEIYSPEVRWHTRNGWRSLMGHWPEMRNVVGAIDGTSHKIYRHQTELQEEFYSGHRH